MSDSIIYSMLERNRDVQVLHACTNFSKHASVTKRQDPGLRHLEFLEGRVLPALLAPGVVATGSSSSAIVVSWKAETNPAVTGYDLYERVWVVPSHGGKGSSGGGHYVYNLMASNLTTTTAPWAASRQAVTTLIW